MKAKKLIVATCLALPLVGMTAQLPKNAGSETVMFRVGMSCDACQMKIEENMGKEKGVKNLMVDLNTQTVGITFDTQATDVLTLQKAIEDLGYEVYLPGSDCCYDGRGRGCHRAPRYHCHGAVPHHCYND